MPKSQSIYCMYPKIAITDDNKIPKFERLIDTLLHLSTIK